MAGTKDQAPKNSDGAPTTHGCIVTASAKQMETPKSFFVRTRREATPGLSIQPTQRRVRFHTVNIEGARGNQIYLKKLLDTTDFIFLQEHWLWQFEANFWDSCAEGFDSHSRSIDYFDLASPVSRGGARGGTECLGSCLVCASCGGGLLALVCSAKRLTETGCKVNITLNLH